MGFSIIIPGYICINSWKIVGLISIVLGILQVPYLHKRKFKHRKQNEQDPLATEIRYICKLCNAAVISLSIAPTILFPQLLCHLFIYFVREKIISNKTACLII